jgi:hypothetical protein
VDKPVVSEIYSCVGWYLSAACGIEEHKVALAQRAATDRTTVPAKYGSRVALDWFAVNLTVNYCDQTGAVNALFRVAARPVSDAQPSAARLIQTEIVLFSQSEAELLRKPGYFGFAEPFMLHGLFARRTRNDTQNQHQYINNLFHRAKV